MHSDHFLDIHQLSNTEMGDWKDPAVLVKLSSTTNSGDYKDLMQKYVPRRNELKEDAKVISFHFEPFLKPLNQDDVYWSRLNLRISNMPIIVFITMAVLILLIACFNLTNTTIATTSKRFKEVGIRKVVGASRKQIIIQFLLEMTFTVLVSLVVAVIVSSYIVGEFAAMWGLPFGLKDLNGLNLIFALLFLVFVSSLLAGLYPALHNSKIKPVTLLSNKVRLKGGSWFTNVLVSLQFSISVIVLINGIVFIQNAKFQESIDYGFDMQKILTVFIQNESEYKILKQRIEANPRVKSIAVSHHQLGMSSYPFPVFIDTSEYSVQHIEIGENFFQTMGLELVTGRFPDINMTRDEFESIVVNEAFIEHAGISGDPLLATVKVRDQKRRIIGVVKNHVDNLFRSDEPEPFVYYGSKRNEYQVMLIKTAAKDLVNVKDDVESIWKEEFPDKAFTAEFQEELTLGGLRQTNSNMKKIFIFLTILGTLLSASGIFALSSLNVDRRIKEIGVRKVLGGSVNHIIFILGKSFTFMLLISILLGSAVGYFLSTSLFDNIYAYHIQVNIWPLLLASIIILIVGVLSTTSVIWKAAVANPVESLRSE
jgi:ABC-type antimicrobial peptide transport system permease subunit